MQCSVLDTNIVYVSTSTLLETQGIVTSKEILSATYEVIKNIAVGVIDIVDPPRLGFQLTLKLHLDNIPRGKGKHMLLYFFFFFAKSICYCIPCFCNESNY